MCVTTKESSKHIEKSVHRQKETKKMRRFNQNFKFLSTTSKRFCSSSSSSSTSTPKFQYYHQAGRVAGVLLPFAAVWAASSILFPSSSSSTSQQQQQHESEERFETTSIDLIQPSNPNSTNTLGGSFQMMDCKTKKQVTEKEVFEISDHVKKWSLLYFGFSKCAEVCPRNLKFMTTVIENLPDPEMKKDVQIVFVSVDPIRDKPDALEKYLSERIPAEMGILWKGLVGDEKQVSHICKTWRVYYSSMNESQEEQEAREAVGMSLEEALGKDNENYQLDHSAAVYFVAPNGKLRDLFFEEMGAEHATDRVDLHLSGAYSGLNKV
jgi:cytochrome oxidase Cu insertion factor (SCO1/SenC/PrrC family)